MKVYIAGPMTGYEEYNYPAFNVVAGRWREAGWQVFNPAEHELPTAEQEATLTADEIRALYMRKDIEWVMGVDAVALLPGWEKSKGANTEISVARILGLDIYDAETFLPYVENGVDLEWGDELRTTDSATGGMKGTKIARMDLIPVLAQIEEAKVFGFGAGKYEDNNWRKGYKWSLSYAALLRHLAAFWAGQDVDPESAELHLAHARWHTGVLIEFFKRGLGTDDRVKVV